MYFRRNPSWDDLWQAAKNQYLLTHSSIDKALWVQIQAQIDPLCQDPQCLFKGRFQKGIPYRPSRTQTVEVEFTQSLGRIQDFCDYCQKFLCEGCEHQPSPPEASSKCAGCGIEFTKSRRKAPGFSRGDIRRVKNLVRHLS